MGKVGNCFLGGFLSCSGGAPERHAELVEASCVQQQFNYSTGMITSPSEMLRLRGRQMSMTFYMVFIPFSP
jgi:hypothetical protein